MKEHLTIDLEAEKKIIRKKIELAFEVENRKDVEAIMDLDFFAGDIIAHGPNMPPIKGLEGIRKFYTEYFKIMESIKGGSTEIHVSENGDIAWDHGWNRTVYKGLEGPIEEEGKYMEIWEKRNGTWKVVAASFSSDQPAK